MRTLLAIAVFNLILGLRSLAQVEVEMRSGKPEFHLWEVPWVLITVKNAGDRPVSICDTDLNSSCRGAFYILRGDPSLSTSVDLPRDMPNTQVDCAFPGNGWKMKTITPGESYPRKMLIHPPKPLPPNSSTRVHIEMQLHCPGTEYNPSFGFTEHYAEDVVVYVRLDPVGGNTVR